MAMATAPYVVGEATRFSNGGPPGTPSKRTANGTSPIVAKRQRSFRLSPTQERPTSMTTSTPEATHMRAASNGALSSEQERQRSSVLKSSLKSGLAGGNHHLSSGLDSPSESDKRSMYYDYVRNALQDKARGRDVGYDELVAQFSLPSRTSVSAPPSLGILQMLLHALTGVASKLDRRNHSQLVNAILVLPWAIMGGDAFARTWTRFVCTLCSVRSEWVGEVLSRAIKGLSYRSDWRSMAYAPATSSSKPTRRLIYARIHVLLRSLLSLIPTLPTQIAPLLLRHFPHKGEGIREHIVYVQNMFDLCDYAEELRSSVLEYVIARGLEIDVEIQIELDDLEEAEADFEDGAGSDDDSDAARPSKQDLEQDLFDKPLEDDSDSDDGDGSDDGAGLDDLDSDGEENFDDFIRGKSQTERERIGQVRKLVDKLDAIMSTLFSHIEQVDTRFAEASKGLNGQADVSPARAITMRNEQFGNLMRIFERSLLPTFKSRHIQFLLFWLSSLERNFSDQFLGMLLGMAVYANGGANGSTDRVNMHGSSTVMRIAASSYVASFVSRAKFIDAQDARIVMLNLCAFLNAHLDAFDPAVVGEEVVMSSIGSDPLGGPHAIFYAVAQACLYIFCFRWRDLQSSTSNGDAEGSGDDDEDESEGDKVVQWSKGLEAIKRAILSPLNPLAHCSSTVVRQFAGVSQLTGFMYCWSVVERNSRRGGKRAEGTTLSPTQANGLPSVNSSASGVPSPLAASKVAVGRSDIDSFFPFDPYRLRGSTKWVEPIYREWSDVAPSGMLEDSDDEDDTAEEEEVVVDSSESDDNDDDARAVESTTAMRTPARESRARNGLTIPGTLPSHHHQHKPLKPSKLSKAHAPPHSFGASVSTDDSSSVAQSLEAMSISPRYV